MSIYAFLEPIFTIKKPFTKRAGIGKLNKWLFDCKMDSKIEYMEMEENFYLETVGGVVSRSILHYFFIPPYL